MAKQLLAAATRVAVLILQQDSIIATSPVSFGACELSECWLSSLNFVESAESSGVGDATLGHIDEAIARQQSTAKNVCVCVCVCHCLPVNLPSLEFRKGQAACGFVLI